VLTLTKPPLLSGPGTWFTVLSHDMGPARLSRALPTTSAMRPDPGVMGHLGATLGTSPRTPPAPPRPASVARHLPTEMLDRHHRALEMPTGRARASTASPYPSATSRSDRQCATRRSRRRCASLRRSQPGPPQAAPFDPRISPGLRMRCSWPGACLQGGSSKWRLLETWGWRSRAGRACGLGRLRLSGTRS
jgi:hypothetical protein